MNLLRTTYPESIVNIRDESAGTRILPTITRPLHQPLVFIRAAKGDDKCTWVTGSTAVEKYGSQTFDIYEKYWRAETYLLQTCILPYQGCYVKRIIPPGAKPSAMVIEAHVTSNVDIPVYKRNSDGSYYYDDNTGEKVQETDDSRNPVTVKGTKVSYHRRGLTDAELSNGYDVIPIKTVSNGDQETKIYPIVACLYKSPSSLGDKTGIKLFINYASQSEELLDATHSLVWNFVPMEQPYNSDIAYEIADKFGTKVTQFVMKPNQVDPYTQRRISADDTLLRLYYDEVAEQYLMPFDISFYSDNIKEIGDRIVETEAEYDSTLTDGWMVNITEMLNLAGNPYNTAILDEEDPESVSLASLSVHYLTGGSDGDTSDEAFEDGVRAAFLMRSDPELIDRFHYSITHIYDIGYPLDIKFAMADFIAKQGYCKAILSTQDSKRHMYDMDEASSVAAAIRARCALTPESELYGTSAMRATIFAQAGHINDTTIKGIVPMTFWNAMSRSQYHGGMSLRGSWSTYPANVVSMYRDINFVPYSPTQKQILWDGAANYVQWKNGNDLFMPAARSIYKDTTSLLVDDEFTDACIYTKYAIDSTWTDYVNRKEAFSIYASNVQEDLNARLLGMFGTIYTATTSMYLTDEDLQNNDTCTVDVTLTGGYPKRIWRSTIIVRGTN